MEPILLTLPSGYTVSFKPYLTHGQRRELTKFISSRMSVDPINGKTETNINGSIVMEAQDLTLKQMLNYVQKPDGTQLVGDDAFSEIQNMRDDEGTAVYAKIDEITGIGKTTEEDKKKLN